MCADPVRNPRMKATRPRAAQDRACSGRAYAAGHLFARACDRLRLAPGHRAAEATGDDLQAAVHGLRPGQRAGADPAPIGPAGPRQGGRHMHEADAAIAARVRGDLQRVIQHGIAQVGARVARGVGRDAAPLQGQHEVRHGQAWRAEIGAAIAHGAATAASAPAASGIDRQVLCARCSISKPRAREDTPKCSTRSGCTSASSRCEASRSHRPFGRQHLGDEARIGKGQRRPLGQLRHQPHGGVDRHARKRPERGQQHGRVRVCGRQDWPAGNSSLRSCT